MTITRGKFAGECPLLGFGMRERVAWLDDETGKPRRPRELWIRTPGTEAIYGKNSPDYLHSNLFSPTRSEVLASLGVSGDPSRSELVNRLKELRDESGVHAGTTGHHLMAETGIVYRALSESLAAGTSTSDLTVSQLRTEFNRPPGLLLTNHGWLPSSNVFKGPPILGDFGAFAPSIEGGRTFVVPCLHSESRVQMIVLAPFAGSLADEVLRQTVTKPFSWDPCEHWRSNPR